MQTLLQDLRFALRTLRKSPVFTTVAILSLALGIGANTAIFTLMDQVLLRALPIKDPQRLVMLDAPGPSMGSRRAENSFSYPMYKELRDQNQVFEGVIARYPTSLSMTYKGQTERIDSEIVTGNFFDVLGVQAAIGRTLTQEDDRTPGGHPVTVLSHGFWTRRFGANPNILNQTISLNGTPMTVVGVTAAGFRGVEVGTVPDVFVPTMMKAQMTPTWDDLNSWRSMWLHVFARLKPNLSPQQAQAGLQVLYQQLLQEDLKTIPEPSARFRERFLHRQIQVMPGQTGRSDLRRQFTTPLIVLMGMVGLVLLIACANVANLLVARAAARQREVAIRLALGAGRLHIMRQLMVESLVLALCGGGLGILVAVWTGDALIHVMPSEGAVRSFNAYPDVGVLGFAFALSVLTGILFGLIPALQATRPGLASTLKEEAGSVSAAGSQVRFRKMLVVAQVALSLLLLIGAGLFARSLGNLRNLDPGFRTDNLLTFSIDPTLNGYDANRSRTLFQQLQQQIAAVPGVRSVSMAAIGSMTGNEAIMSITVEGHPRKEGEDYNPHANWIGPAYFSTMGMPLLIGREFTERDTKGSPKVCIINESLAKQFWPNGNPLGKHIGLGRDQPNMEVVGVVKDSRHTLQQKVFRFLYMPNLQEESFGGMTIYARTATPAANMAPVLRREVQKMDANLPVFDMKTMETQVSESLFIERVVAALSAFFGFLATLLAAVGLYGVTAYSVARRTREIGIRMALGAERQSVLWLVLKEVTLMAVVGIGIGLPCALALSRLIESQLVGLSPYDPFTIVIAVLTLVGVTLASGAIPAERATRVDPLVALRYE